MGSPCQVQLQGEDPALLQSVGVQLEAEARRLEAKYSRFLPDSLTTRINQAAGSGSPVAIDEETARLLDYADTCWRQSDGLFDITSGSLRSLWNYHDLADRQALPTAADIEKALVKIGWQKVERGEDSVALPQPGMEIDFGGIVKEYAADCLATLAERAGVASGLVELGGDIRLVGIVPETKAWQVGIRDPFDTSRACAHISLSQGALASSGDYERYTVIQGRKYSHILNPLTGWPVSGYSSVSVVAEQCVIAGTAATIAMLRGTEGETWLKELGLPYLSIDQDGRIGGSIAGDLSGVVNNGETG
jgi:thiamine biosynthesis lipoprotein